MKELKELAKTDEMERKHRLMIKELRDKFLVNTKRKGKKKNNRTRQRGRARDRSRSPEMSSSARSRSRDNHNLQRPE